MQYKRGPIASQYKKKAVYNWYFNLVQYSQYVAEKGPINA